MLTQLLMQTSAHTTMKPEPKAASIHAGVVNFSLLHFNQEWDRISSRQDPGCNPVSGDPERPIVPFRTLKCDWDGRKVLTNCPSDSYLWLLQKSALKWFINSFKNSIQTASPFLKPFCSPQLHFFLYFPQQTRIVAVFHRAKISICERAKFKVQVHESSV